MLGLCSPSILRVHVHFWYILFIWIFISFLIVVCFVIWIRICISFSLPFFFLCPSCVFVFWFVLTFLNSSKPALTFWKLTNGFEHTMNKTNLPWKFHPDVYECKKNNSHSHGHRHGHGHSNKEKDLQNCNAQICSKYLLESVFNQLGLKCFQSIEILKWPFRSGRRRTHSNIPHTEKKSRNESESMKFNFKNLLYHTAQLFELYFETLCPPNIGAWVFYLPKCMYCMLGG